MEFNQRLESLIKTLRLNKNSFSKEIGLENNVVIGRLVKEESRKPSFEILAKILRSFPNINPRWLILGQGEMFLGDQDDLPDFSDRVGRVMKYLLKTPFEMADLTGLSVKEMGGLLMQDTIFSDNKISEIAKSISDSYPEVSLEWLVKNQTPMILSEKELGKGLLKQQIPIVEHPGEEKLHKSNPQDFIMVKGFSEGFAIQMYGENMKPVLSPSDILICREIPAKSILFGQIHMLLWGANMKRVGYVKKGKEDGILELRSENPEFEPVILSSGDVNSVFLLEGVIKRINL